MDDDIAVKVEPRICDPEMLPKEKPQSSSMGSAMASAIKKTFNTSMFMYIAIIIVIILLIILAYNWWTEKYTTPPPDIPDKNIPPQVRKDTYSKDDLMKIYSKMKMDEKSAAESNNREKMRNNTNQTGEVSTADDKNNTVVDVTNETVNNADTEIDEYSSDGDPPPLTEEDQDNTVNPDNKHDGDIHIIDISVLSGEPSSVKVEEIDDGITCPIVLKSGKQCRGKPKSNGRCARHQ